MIESIVKTREEDLEDSLNKIFAYCKEHTDTCIGCIFWREVSIGNHVEGHCRVMYAPEVFGESTGGTVCTTK